VELRLCDRTFTLSFGSPDAPWAFSAVNANGVALADGRLSDTMQHVPLGLAGVDAAALRMAPLQESSEAAPHTMAEQLFGTGPWQWAGHSGLSFLRGGRLVTPWGTGTWGVQRRGGDEKVPATDSIFADFGGGEHTLTARSWPCLFFRSERKADGEKVRLDFVGGHAPDAASCLFKEEYVAA